MQDSSTQSATCPNATSPSTRVFENDFAEKYLSRVHPVLPGLFWGPIALGVLGWSYASGASWIHISWIFLTGFFAWTFFEYVLHRWIFHFIPGPKWLRREWYLIHQIHHDHQEWDRIVAPPLLSGTLCVFFLALFWALFGPVWMWPFFSGFVLGYLAYDYAHYYTHFGKPRSRFAKGLRRRHLQHHHAFPDRWYGVSSPFWDYVFGTHVRPGDKPTAKKETEWPKRLLERPVQ